MNRHLVLISDLEFERILLGAERYLIRFFKKRLDFINRLNVGDIIFFKKNRGEVLGQFNVGKIVLIEKIDDGDFKILKEFSISLTKGEFDKKLQENNTLVVVQIDNLEQFITSPVDVPARIRKEWVVLGDK